MRRADWGVVVGVDQYVGAKDSLDGAVRDALRFRTWLLDGLGVPEDQVFVSLSPRHTSPAVDPAMVVFPATRTGVRDALDELRVRLDIAIETPRRLFLYFAGHGITSRRSGIGEQALLTADFSCRNPDNSISVPSLLDWLQGLPIPDQFIFIDGCRNAPMDGLFHVGRMPFDNPPSAGAPIVQQFVFNATASGLKAYELGPAGEEHGVFGNELVTALTRCSGAMTWDADAAAYVVRWRALTDWVAAQVVARGNAPGGECDSMVQVPRTGGEQNAPGRDPNPVLVVLDASAVPDAVLTIDVDPCAAAPNAILQVFDPSDPLHPRIRGPQEPIPLDLSLPPRDYVIAARADGWTPARQSWPAVLRDQLAVCVEFTRDDGDDGQARTRNAQPADPRHLRSKDGGQSRAAPASITVQSADALAQLEIVDSSGRVRATGMGHELTLSNAAPGTYTLRLSIPEGDVNTTVISVMPGANERVDLLAPGRRVPVPSLDALVQAGLTHGNDVDILGVSERLGPMAGAEASTILAIAAARAVHGRRLDGPGGWGHLVQRLGIDAPPETGIQVLLADELAGPVGVASAHIRVAERALDNTAGFGTSRLTGAARLPVSPVGPADAAMGQAQHAVSPGVREVLLGGPSVPTIRLLVPVFERHVSQLIVHRRSDGDVHIFLQTPGTGEQPDGAGWDFDPNDVRVLELAQRWMLRGRYDMANADALAALRWSAPIAQLLAGYLFLRSGRGEEAMSMSGRLADRRAFWCDAGIIRGELARRAGDAESSNATFAQALDRPGPIFAGGLRLLADAAVRMWGELPEGSRMRTAIGRRVSGVLWTAETV